MSARTKRIRDGVIVIVGALAVGIAALVGAVVGDAERISSYWTAAHVDAEGRTTVAETIDYEFGAQSRHGIFRDIPGLADFPADVSSPTAPDQFERISKGFDVVQLKIGDRARTITGRHRYEIDYALADLAASGQLAWNAVGTEWPVDIERVEIHIVGSHEFTAVRCVRGRFGADDACPIDQTRPGHLVVALDDLGSNEGVTVYATEGRALGPGEVPSAPVRPRGPADDDGAGLVQPMGLAAAAAVVGGFVALTVQRRRGRELIDAGAYGSPAAAAYPPPPDFTPEPAPAIDLPGTRRIDATELADYATIEFVPPAGLTPAQGGVVLRETVREEHKMAWLVHQAFEGAVEIDDTGLSPALVWTGAGGAPANDILVRAFKGRDRVELGSYDSAFKEAWAHLDHELNTWRRSSDLWTPEGNRSRKRSVVVGFLLQGVGAIGTFFAAGAANGPVGGPVGLVAVSAAVAGFGLGFFAAAWELLVRSPIGSAVWLRLESFRRFLRESEATHADWAAENGILREYTAWAFAVGEIDHWSKAVAASTVAPSMDPMAFHTVALSHSLSSSMRTATVAPSSSGGGGGGGGVGGGGGGGGGGSW